MIKINKFYKNKLDQYFQFTCFNNGNVQFKHICFVKIIPCCISFLVLVSILYSNFCICSCFAQPSFPNIAERSTTVTDILRQHQSNPKADTYYLLALAAARKNNFNEAFKNIQIGLSNNPNHIQLLSLRAALWAKTGKLSEAFQEFKRLSLISPNDEYIKYSLQELQRYLEPKISPSLKTSSQSISKSSKNALNNNFSIQSSSKQFIQQSNSDKKILSSDYFIKLNAKKTCCLNMGQINKAILNLKSIDPKKNIRDIKDLINEGHLQTIPVCPENGKYSLNKDLVCCSIHGDIVTLEAEITTVYSDFNKAIQSKFAKNYVSALKSFEHVCSIYPNWAEAHYQRADTLFRLGQDQQALDAIKTCLKIDPQNIDAKMLLAHILYKIGNIKDATQILKQIEATEQDSVYGMSVKALLKAIKAGKSYYEVFPPSF